MARSITQSTVTGLMPFGNGVVILYKAGATFVVPAGIRKVRATALGSGSGGLANSHAASTTAYPVYGGSGGGFASKTIDVSPGDSFVITVAAGGLGSVLYSGTTLLQAATAGGTSSFGAVISATGGALATSGSGSGSPGVVGAPGQGFGGDVNYSGGRSGIIQPTVTGGTFPHALGGGAAGHAYGDGGRGGDLANIATTNILGAATGGGAVGGRNGGDIQGDGAYPGQYLASPGAGVGGHGVTPAAGGYTSVAGGPRNPTFEVFAGEDSAAVPTVPMWHLLLPLLGAGQGLTYASDVWTAVGNPARGAGTAGRLARAAYASTLTAASALVGGGGGGAVHLNLTDGMNATGGDGGYGAGGGGASGGSGLNLYIRGGAGGQGLVLVEF